MAIKCVTWKKWMSITFENLNQEEIENMNRPITNMEIETVIKNLPTNKIPGQIASQVNSTKNLEMS